MLKRRSVAEWLRRGPVAGCEMQVADEEQFDLCARLVEPAQLGKACRQETDQTLNGSGVARQT